MLPTDESPIGDIASQCGFDDSSYFSHIFRLFIKRRHPNSERQLGRTGTEEVVEERISKQKEPDFAIWLKKAKVYVCVIECD